MFSMSPLGNLDSADYLALICLSWHWIRMPWHNVRVHYATLDAEM